jgi:hypothetical protein
MTSNIGIMQITSQFEPFDNIMQPQTTFWTKHDFSKMIFKSGDNCIYGNPLGSNTHILTQFTINIGVNIESKSFSIFFIQKDIMILGELLCIIKWFKL